MPAPQDTQAPGFDVTVEQVIGRVELGHKGRHPYEAAFGIIGKHQTDPPWLDVGDEAKYRFVGPHEGTTYTVAVSLAEDN